jgi:NAD(P)-dependent dehydrogenase (short-subunit alcohol dehydrogenase family)
MPTILITGANRGIGKRLAELYAGDQWDVVAGVRDPEAYDGPGEALTLDVTNGATIAAAKSALGRRPIDILWNNAGVYLDKDTALDELDWGDWEETFRVNTIGPIRLAQALMDNVAASEKRLMAFTSSKMGSITRLSSGSYCYRSSKSALNMAVAVLTKDVANRGIATLLLHPGWVRTDMGGAEADIDTDTAAAGMKVIAGAHGLDRSGAFLSYDGTEIPW